ncbi:MAG: adenylosuccinate lyase, partial [Actinomycetota bacterium]|nr:adenylosuccinate lyase [Actinomycetota bacterium]
YRVVQRNAMAAWDGKGQLMDLLATDPEVQLTTERLDDCFSLERVNETATPVFERLERLAL